MKKYLALILAILLILSLVGCNSSAKNASIGNDATKVEGNNETNNGQSESNDKEQENSNNSNDKVENAQKDEVKIKNNIIYQTLENKAKCKLKINIQFPSIENNANNDAYTKINNSIEKLKDSLKSNTDVITADFEQETDEYPSDLSYNLTYNTTLQNKNYVSFQFILDAYFGGPHPDTEPFARTYDLNTGEEVTFDTMFNISYDEYIDLLMSYIMDQSKERFKDDDNVIEDLDKDMLKSNLNTNNFYIKDNNLVVFYYSYDFLCYAAGNQEFIIPLDEIKDKLAIDFSDNN